MQRVSRRQEEVEVGVACVPSPPLPPEAASHWRSFLLTPPKAGKLRFGLASRLPMGEASGGRAGADGRARSRGAGLPRRRRARARGVGKRAGGSMTNRRGRAGVRPPQEA